MKKVNGIFIDLRKAEQVEWWNKIGSKLVKVVRYDTLVETATNEPVGVMFAITGVFAKYVIKKNNSFLGNNLKKMVVDL